MKKSTYIPATTLLILIAAPALASNVHIKNDDSTEVRILIEPVKDNCLIIKHEPRMEINLQPGEERIVIINERTFQGVNFNMFSIIGKVKVPSLYNKCCPLSLKNKDHKIIFVGGRLGGTICIANP